MTVNCPMCASTNTLRVAPHAPQRLACAACEAGFGAAFLRRLCAEYAALCDWIDAHPDVAAERQRESDRQAALASRRLAKRRPADSGAAS